jgi:hypothetical protein
MSTSRVHEHLLPDATPDRTASDDPLLQRWLDRAPIKRVSSWPPRAGRSDHEPIGDSVADRWFR